MREARFDLGASIMPSSPQEPVTVITPENLMKIWIELHH